MANIVENRLQIVRITPANYSLFFKTLRAELKRNR